MPNATAPQKKWYVHDEYDCFSDFETAEAAAACAKSMAEDQELNGVHIVHMTQVQHDEYCTNGDLRAAMQLSGT